MCNPWQLTHDTPGSRWEFAPSRINIPHAFQAPPLSPIIYPLYWPSEIYAVPIFYEIYAYTVQLHQSASLIRHWPTIFIKHFSAGLDLKSFVLIQKCFNIQWKRERNGERIRERKRLLKFYTINILTICETGIGFLFSPFVCSRVTGLYVTRSQLVLPHRVFIPGACLEAPAIISLTQN